MARTASSCPRCDALTAAHQLFTRTGCLGVVVVFVGIIVAIYVLVLVTLAIQVALYVVAALAALLVVRPFSRWALPAVRGGVFNASAFSETSALGMFAIGAVPTALVYPLTHGVATLAGAAIVGGLGFRPLVRALDGKALPTLPLGRGKDIEATPTVGLDLTTPGEFGLWIGEATARSQHSATPPVCNAVPTSR